MSDTTKSSGIEHRRDERLPLDEAVTVEVDTAVITGSGQNISTQGVFFTADGLLPVRVRIGGRTQVLQG